MKQIQTWGAEINRALFEYMKDPRTLMMGQDIEDPFGGVFRITKGLSTAYPGRVLNTPISESATVGIAVGLAMQGFKPVVEVMFQNFLTLCVDQLYHGQKVHKLIQPAPVTIRTVVGRPGYGFTHEGEEFVWHLGHLVPLYTPKTFDEYLEVLNRPHPKIILEYSEEYKKPCRL